MPPANAPKNALLVCNCQRSMEIDGAALGRALGASAPIAIHTELCRGQVSTFEAALATGGPLTVACTQEAPLFSEIAEEKGAAPDVRPAFVNIRERAGWCREPAAALPKMAALLADATFTGRPTPEVTLKSGGLCLVYGAGQLALDTALELSSRLDVTLLLSDARDVIPPSTAQISILSGRIRVARGHIGAFDIEVDGYATALPSSRSALTFAMARDGAKSRCDLILDLSGGAALFPAHDKRDGYKRADPGNPAAVARAMYAITDLVGEFAKPRYVAFDAGICAHARSQKVGCRNCLDVCPMSAISPAGDHVAIDAAVCGGCGSCSAVCPTGAASYDYPGREDLLRRVQGLIGAYTGAGGKRPILLLHDDKHGAPLISAMARFGGGLPVNVIPLSVYSVFVAGHDTLVAMLASGAEQVVLLTPPAEAHELPALSRQIELVDALLDGLGHGRGRVQATREVDPEALEAWLRARPVMPTLPPARFLTTGSKRDVARLAIARLAETAAPSPATIPLPVGAPYGRIVIDDKACTLCLACVGACPASALADHPDRPQVALTEAACVQCGVCVATCPERAITLEPRYNLQPAALSPEVLHGEEPFHCVTCGKAFGTKATIDRVVGRLKGHSMFQNEGQLALIQMCDTCRVVTLAERGGDPLGAGPRPAIRTTEDDLLEQARAATGQPKKGLKPDDFLS